MLLNVLLFIHAAAGAWVSIEAINALHRTPSPLDHRDDPHLALTALLRGVAWLSVLLGALSAVVNPLMPHEHVELWDVLTMVGIAGLLVLARLRCHWERCGALVLRSTMDSSMLIERANAGFKQHARDET